MLIYAFRNAASHRDMMGPDEGWVHVADDVEGLRESTDDTPWSGQPDCCGAGVLVLRRNPDVENDSAPPAWFLRCEDDPQGASDPMFKGCGHKFGLTFKNDEEVEYA